MTQRKYRFRVFQHNSTSLSTGGGNLAWQTTMLSEAPTIRSPIIRPTLGRSESQQWVVSILDQASSITSHIADSSGRLDQLGRLVSVDDNGTVIGTGRIADLILSPNVATWQFNIEDERRIERLSMIFSTNTTRLYPASPNANYGPFKTHPKGRITPLFASSSQANKVRVVTFNDIDLNGITPAAQQAIAADLSSAPFLASTAGNFKHLKLRVGAVDYPVVTFGSALKVVGAQGKAIPTNAWTDSVDNLESWTVSNAGTKEHLKVWVRATSSQLVLNTVYSSAFLHMFGALPSEGCPLHIGATSSGVSLRTLLANIWSGAYSTNGTPKVRYSTAALDKLSKQPLPPIRYRITQRENMADWLERTVYQPFLLSPMVDSQGRVAPVSLRLPNSTATITKTLTASNLTDPHPTWQQFSREAVTSLRVLATYEGIYYHVSETTQRGGDGMTVRPTTTILTHDRVNKVGLHEIQIDAAGIHAAGQIGVAAADRAPLTEYLQGARREFFDRYGDGPLMGRFTALSSASTVRPGDWVRLNLQTFPNPQTRVRGGVRIVQILGREDQPSAYAFDYLDGGPDLGVLASPSLSLANSTVDGKHSLVATIGTVPAGGAVQLDIAPNSSLPASSSPLWRTIASVNSSQKVNIAQLPANTKYFAHARATKPGRLRSAWTISTGKTTSALTAPSALASTSVTGGYFTGVWTAGEDSEMTSVHLDTSTSASISTGNEVGRIRTQGQTRHQFTNLTQATKYLWGVRHYDGYGGYSSGAKATVTTSSGTMKQAPTPLGIQVLSGVP